MIDKYDEKRSGSAERDKTAESRRSQSAAANAAPTAAADSTRISSPTSEEDPLIAELREAYGDDTDRFAKPGPCLLGGPDGSSAAYCRAASSFLLPPGSRVGDFEIRGVLGQGGMGVVYRARQVSLNRDVALKMLPGPARFGPQAVQRFQIEAQAAARLHHTNIVPVYAQGEHEGRAYYTMELVEGIGLDGLILGKPDRLLSVLRDKIARASTETAAARSEIARSNPSDAASHRNAARVPESNRWQLADFRRLAGWLAEIAEALEWAHRHGVVHRDVKPHNILCGRDRRLYLTDFGLARLADEPHLTLSGEVMGTPAYLSPEQLNGRPEDVDHRTDVYSLGVTLYELVTQKKPFIGETRERIMAAVCRGEPTPPRRLNPDIPANLETICLRSMARNPQDRYVSAAALADDLRRFSEGRPIRARRSGPLVRALKWARRRRTLSITLAAGTAAILLISALSWNLSLVRTREMQQRLQGAYDRLVYLDYRAPDLVTADIGQAAAFGLADRQVLPAEALAALGAADEERAGVALARMLEMSPQDQRALYLLAWARRRVNDVDAARDYFSQAESLGAPSEADVWFFRGLASHYDDAETAIESYRNAIAARASQHDPFPQAVLHLARARNQRLYATRSLEGFFEAETALRQLIDQQLYANYPYYLLSITHRLAAEIYSGSAGTRDDNLVREHYQQALDWARRGQEIEPSDDRPLTAEAECLESMGLYAEALERRSAAIETAVKPRAVCEGYHYRWRLSFWLDDPEAAWRDVLVHQECMPESRFYQHVYPALILAEQGRTDEAAAHAYALIEEAPLSANAALWAGTTLRLLGRAAEAQTLLLEQRDRVDFLTDLTPYQTEEWLRELYAAALGETPTTPLDDLADACAQPWRLWGEAAFHRAALDLARGDRDAALEGFRRAYRSFDSELDYSFHGKLLFIKMTLNPSWPAWCAAADLPRSESNAPSTDNSNESSLDSSEVQQP